MEITLEGLKEYVLLRRDAFEYKYDLNGMKRNPLYRKHYPNNLKYLDKMSQILIRTMNNHPVPIREKLLTVLVYRFVGDKDFVRRHTNKQGMITLKELNILAKKLDNEKTVLVHRYATPISKRGITGLSRGEFLLAVACDFLDKLPPDNFYKWKTSEIARQFIEFENVYGISYTMAYQLASDISYINELCIKIDFIKAVPERAREMFSYITGQPYRLERYEQFTYEFMDWYANQDFLENKERLVLPHDVTQMLLGYRLYVFKGGLITRHRTESKPRNITRGIVISRSMYEYYKESVDSKKD